MNFSFHYYGTYCAAREAGFNSDDSWVIAHAAQFVDECSKALLANHNKVGVCPTYHTNNELFTMNLDWFGAPVPQEIPQVWTSFHFLPGNIDENGKCRLRYRNKDYLTNSVETEIFKLTCLPYSCMVGKIVDAAKSEYASTDNSANKKLCYIGMVMHVLADTFAHEYFVGTPSKAINEVSWVTEFDKYEQISPYGFSNIKSCEEKKTSHYLYSPAFSSTSVGWLGHGRCGTYPDIPDKKYFYRPNWDPNAECVKNNPILHLCAFIQMRNAMKFIINAEDNAHFNYKEEMTADEYKEQYSKDLMKIFLSDGSENNQKVMWAQHITNTYAQSVMSHDVDRLASNNNFLDDFIDNANKHRQMVWQYCLSIFPSFINCFKK